MKKNIVLIVLSLLSLLPTSAQNKEETVTLSEAHPNKTFNFDGLCNIYVHTASSSNDGYADVSITIENQDDNHVLFIAGKAFTERELRRLMKPTTIAFDKKSFRSKEQRVPNFCEDMKKDNYHVVYYSQKKVLLTKTIKKGKERVFNLPIYVGIVGKKKFLGIPLSGSNKISLVAEQKKILKITVEDKPDEDFIRISGEVDKLMDDLKKLNGKPLCTNSRHKPSLKEQKKPYERRISNIKSDIDEAIRKSKSNSYIEGNSKYADIKDKLSRIDLSRYEGDCGRHRDPVHQCRYCNHPLKDIYDKLDKYYMQIRNSSDRKAAKASVIDDVNALYKCYKNGGYKKSSSANNALYLEKIPQVYNRISEF